MKTEQIWKIGDCLELLPELKDKSVDLVLTDPPYGISKQSNIHTMKDRLFRTGIDFGDWDDTRIVKEILPEIERILKNDGAMLMFYDQLKIHEISIMNPRRCIYWKKTNPFPIQQNPFPLSAVECVLYSTKSKTGTYNGNGEHNWFECNSPLPFERFHPTQKPIALIEWLLKLFSNEGDLICDPFLGSGTTLQACMNLNRNCIGFEIDPRWEHIYRKRLRLDNTKLDAFNTSAEPK